MEKSHIISYQVAKLSKELEKNVKLLKEWLMMGKKV